MRPQPGRLDAVPPGEPRHRILHAGLDLFGTVGFANTPLAAIQAAAEVSNQEYYREFADRQDLLITLFDEINTTALHAVAVAMAGLPEPTVQSQLAVGVRAHLGYAAGDPRRARVAYVEMVGVNAETEAVRSHWRQRWITFITESLHGAVFRGELRDRDYTSSAGAFVGAVNGVLQDWATSDPRAALDGLVGEVSRMGLAVLTR